MTEMEIGEEALKQYWRIGGYRYPKRALCACMLPRHLVVMFAYGTGDDTVHSLLVASPMITLQPHASRKRKLKLNGQWFSVVNVGPFGNTASVMAAYMRWVAKHGS